MWVHQCLFRMIQSLVSCERERERERERCVCMLFLRFEEGGFPYLFTLPAELSAVSCLGWPASCSDFPLWCRKIVTTQIYIYIYIDIL